ncbi:uncharacterized protein LOC108901746 [Lates japonicus]
MEQPTKEKPGCSAASVQTPDILDVNLPNVDPVGILFNISKCLIQLTTQQFELLTAGFVTADMMTVLAFSCMDIIQTYAEAILDGMIPQVYRYIRIYGTFSATILGVTEDRIYAHLKDSIGQALTDCLKINVQTFASTKLFSELLVRHISKTVSSVLDLSTKMPIQESGIPVVFVSGCVTSVRDLKAMAYQMALILTTALSAEQDEDVTLSEFNEDVESPLFCFSSRRDLTKLVRNYITHMVRILKSGVQRPHCNMDSNRRVVCVRVGGNTRILEDSKSPGQESTMPSCSGLVAIPGVVPDGSNAGSNSESYPFRSVTVISPAENHFHQRDPTLELETIRNIAEELVQTLLDDLRGVRRTDGCQKAVLDGLEVVDNSKLRELTDRIFSVIMSGHDYQIPFVPVGTRMCNTVTYRRLREEVTDASSPVVSNLTGV